MSERIEVFLRPSRGRGRIYPRYDDESDILEVGTREHRDWPYGVDVDGNIVFDLDPRKILSNFDLLIGKRLWKRGSLHWPWPERAPEMELGFKDSALATKSFHLPMQVRTNDARSQLTIRFGEEEPAGIPILLSPACVAFVHEYRLLGFAIRLEP